VGNELEEFYQRLAASQVPLEPEIAAALDKYFLELMEAEGEPGLAGDGGEQCAWCLKGFPGPFPWVAT